jgi:hypothetical protein
VLGALVELEQLMVVAVVVAAFQEELVDPQHVITTEMLAPQLHQAEMEERVAMDVSFCNTLWAVALLLHLRQPLPFLLLVPLHLKSHMLFFWEHQLPNKTGSLTKAMGLQLLNR